MEYKDYYATLGLQKDASQQDIQKSYRKLARKYHPDVNKQPGAEERFKEISEAYEVLGDTEKRAKYDQFGSAWRTAQRGGAPPPGWEHFNFDIFGQPGGFDFGLGGQGFSSFFEMLFGSGGGGGPTAWRTAGPWEGPTARGGADQEARISITLREAARGGQRQISLSEADSGRTRTYRIKIPKGVRSGQRIRLAGKGRAGIGGGPPGDLFLRVDVGLDPRFRLEGDDLHTVLPVTPWEAALGGSAELDTLDGRVTVKIPSGSSSGRKIRLRGKGFPKPTGGTGDLLAEIRVVVPSHLSSQERELFEKLAQISSFNARN